MWVYVTQTYIHLKPFQNVTPLLQNVDCTAPSPHAYNSTHIWKGIKNIQTLRAGLRVSNSCRTLLGRLLVGEWITSNTAKNCSQFTGLLCGLQVRMSFRQPTTKLMQFLMSIMGTITSNHTNGRKNYNNHQVHITSEQSSEISVSRQDYKSVLRVHNLQGCPVFHHYCNDSQYSKLFSMFIHVSDDISITCILLTYKGKQKLLSKQLSLTFKAPYI